MLGSYVGCFMQRREGGLHAKITRNVLYSERRLKRVISA